MNGYSFYVLTNNDEHVTAFSHLLSLLRHFPQGILAATLI